MKKLILISELVELIGKDTLKKEGYEYKLDYQMLQSEAHNLLYSTHYLELYKDKMVEEEIEETKDDIFNYKESLGEDWSKLILDNFKFTKEHKEFF